jgi:short-subunit dehydrogenase
MNQLKTLYPKIQFRMIGCDLSKPDFMSKITLATDDIFISLVFNNAGYIKPGLFAQLPLQTLLDNYNTNATCTIAIAHHFIRKMMSEKAKGLVCFTGSSGGFIPGPMSSIYSSTKAWMTNFAASLAAEVVEDGIDVLCVHPSPIASNFYNNASGDF